MATRLHTLQGHVTSVAAPHTGVDDDEIIRLSIRDLVECMSSGQLTAVSVLAAFKRRCVQLHVPCSS